MFWGRNNPVIEGISPNADPDGLAGKAYEWNPEDNLGITMF